MEIVEEDVMENVELEEEIMEVRQITVETDERSLSRNAASSNTFTRINHLVTRFVPVFLMLPGLYRSFVTPRFYLVRRLNTARVVVFDAFCNAVRSMWHLTTPVEVQARGDRFLFTFSNERDLNRVKKGGHWGYQRAMILINDYNGFSNIMVVPLDFVWIWVEIEGLRTALTTVATTRLVGETIGTVLRLRVSPEDVILVKYKYKRLLGGCRICWMLNHGGRSCPHKADDVIVVQPPASVAPPTLAPMVFRANSSQVMIPPSPLLSYLFPLFGKEKRSVQIRAILEFPSPVKLAGVRHAREEDDPEVGKQTKHSLAVIPF
ncbi:hypothetical protein ACLB2K_004724 [Fragaria x ananassa]